MPEESLHNSLQQDITDIITPSTLVGLISSFGQMARMSHLGPIPASGINEKGQIDRTVPVIVEFGGNLRKLFHGQPQRLAAELLEVDTFTPVEEFCP